MCFKHLYFKRSLLGKKKNKSSLVTIEIIVVLSLLHTLRCVELRTELLLQSNRSWFLLCLLSSECSCNPIVLRESFSVPSLHP